MASLTTQATCSYTRLFLGVTDDNGISKYAVPLTTIFTPPGGCRLPIEESAPTRCWPPSSFRVWAGGGFYSPAVCPSGYTVGCTAGASVQILNGVVVRASETAAVCVPSQFVCDQADPTSIQYAVSPVTTGSAAASSYSVPAFQIRWQRADLPCLETPPIPGIYTPTTSRETGSATPESGPLLPSSGLSPGAVAGIVIGVVLILVGALAIAFVMIRRRQRRAARANIAHWDAPAGPGELQGKQISPGPTTRPGHELSGVVDLKGCPLHEISPTETARELSATEITLGQELPDKVAPEAAELPVTNRLPELSAAGQDSPVPVPPTKLSGRQTIKRKSLPVPSPAIPSDPSGMSSNLDSNLVLEEAKP